MPLNLTIKFDENGVPILDRAREAIASIESAGSGGYAAIGPRAKSGDRAYGRYQVMGANIPAWTEQALGKRMTPQQFLASPEAQDAVFNHIFGGYTQKYGPSGAARAWFTGSPTGGGKDILGTSAEQYVNKFNAAMGDSVNQQPQFTFQQSQFGLPVVPAVDVIRGPWGGINEIIGPEMGRRAYKGGSNPGYGSRWRTQEGISQYEAQSGLRPGSLKPVERPPAEVKNLREATPLREPFIQRQEQPKPNWLYDRDATKLNLPNRIAKMVREFPGTKRMLGEWLNQVSQAQNKDQQLKIMQHLSGFLESMGF